MPIIKRCPVCRKRFKQFEFNRRLTCGVKCNKILTENLKPKPEKPTRACKWCEEAFIPRTKLQTFCTDQCRLQSYRSQTSGEAGPRPNDPTEEELAEFYRQKAVERFAEGHLGKKRRG